MTDHGYLMTVVTVLNAGWLTKEHLDHSQMQKGLKNKKKNKKKKTEKEEA